MIELPPKVSNKEYFDSILEEKTAQIESLIEQINDSYDYWSEIKYKKLPEGVSAEKLWRDIRSSRWFKKQLIWNKYKVFLTITNRMQRMCHEFDMNFGGTWGSNSVLPEDNKEQYLISSLMEEAISSSQMEGAATTRKVAKDMLRKNISPRDKSQQMIFNNYQTIRFIVDNKETPLSKELLLQVHALMTEKTLANPLDSGAFRQNNDVVVEDGITHETVHTPPPFEDISEFIDTLCLFFNDENPKSFIHPIIRGIVIHFMIAYVHPFVDGNGRTARALFYWYMLKQGYWLTEYLSISRVIAKSKKAYEKSYLYTEADQNDIGYFVIYNLRVLDNAFKELQKYIRHKLETKKYASKLYRIGNINERQVSILRIISQDSKILLTVKEIQNRFGISHTTAKTDMTKLADRGLVQEIALDKKKRGYIKGSNFDEAVNSIS